MVDEFDKQSEIYDLKELKRQIKVTNVSENTNREKVHWTSSKNYSPDDIITWLHYEKDKPDTIMYRTLYQELQPFVEINVRKKDLRKSVSEKDVELKLAHDGPVPVPEKEVQHLIMLCEDLAIPKRYHSFYYGLKKIPQDEDSSR